MQSTEITARTSELTDHSYFPVLVLSVTTVATLVAIGANFL